MVNLDSRVNAAQARLQQIEAQNLPLQLHLTPQISARAAQEWNQTYDPKNRGAQIAALQSDWNLFSFGSDFALNQSSRAKAAAQRAQIQLTRLSVEEEVWKLAFQLIFATRQLQTLNEIVDARTRVLQLARKRYDSGRLSIHDLTEIEIDRQTSLLQRSQAQQLENQWRKDWESRQGVTGVDLEWPFVKVTISQLRRANQDHPEIQRARLLAKEQAALHRSSFQLLFGEITARGALSAEHTSEWNRTWQMGVFYELPLFDRFKNFAEARSAEYAELELQNLLAHQTRALEARRKGAESNLTFAHESLSLVASGKSLIERSLDIQIKRFESGRMAMTDLLLSLARKSTLELTTLEAQRNWHLAVLEYCQSQGLDVGGCALIP